MKIYKKIFEESIKSYSIYDSERNKYDSKIYNISIDDLPELDKIRNILQDQLKISYLPDPGFYFIFIKELSAPVVYFQSNNIKSIPIVYIFKGNKIEEIQFNKFKKVKKTSNIEPSGVGPDFFSFLWFTFLSAGVSGKELSIKTATSIKNNLLKKYGKGINQDVLNNLRFKNLTVFGINEFSFFSNLKILIEG